MNSETRRRGPGRLTQNARNPASGDRGHLTRRRFLVGGAATAAAAMAGIAFWRFGWREENGESSRSSTTMESETSTKSIGLKLFDAHIHQVTSLPLLDELSILRKAGLSGVVLLGAGSTFENSEMVSSVQKQNADFVFPFANPQRDAGGDRLLFNDATVSYITQQLDSNAWRGIGEVSLRHQSGRDVPGSNYPADGPVALEIYDLAASRKVPVTVHVEEEYSSELERGLEHNHGATIIWAHMGDGQPSLVRDMLENHPNLYVDISSRNPYFQRGHPITEQSITNEDGSLKSDWKSLFERYANRVLFGTDITKGRIVLLDTLMSHYHSVLGQLSPETSAKIAAENITNLLGLK